jgi:hypothetical protein
MAVQRWYRELQNLPAEWTSIAFIDPDQADLDEESMLSTAEDGPFAASVYAGTRGSGLKFRVLGHHDPHDEHPIFIYEQTVAPGETKVIEVGFAYYPWYSVQWIQEGGPGTGTARATFKRA